MLEDCAILGGFMNDVIRIGNCSGYYGTASPPPRRCSTAAPSMCSPATIWPN